MISLKSSLLVMFIFLNDSELLSTTSQQLKHLSEKEQSFRARSIWKNDRIGNIKMVDSMTIQILAQLLGWTPDGLAQALGCILQWLRILLYLHVFLHYISEGMKIIVLALCLISLRATMCSDTCHARNRGIWSDAVSEADVSGCW